MANASSNSALNGNGSPVSVSSLTSRTISGYFWTLGGGAIRSLLKILILALLARLLSPSDFGLVGAAMIVVAFVYVFGQIGVLPAIVQRKELSQADIRTGWTLTLAFGAIVGVLVYLLASWIAGIFRIDRLDAVLQAIAVMFPLRGLGIVGEALLQRRMRFRTMAMIELSSYVFGYAAIAITLAYAGLGVWALVMGQLGQMGFASLSSIIASKHSLRLGFERSALIHLSRFGAGMTLAGCGSFVALNADNFVVGRWLGAEALGFYSRAYYFLMQPVVLIGALGDRVLFPAISSIQSEDQRLIKVYHRSTALIALITSPLSAFLFVFAQEIILLLLGSKWGQAALPFQILVITLPFRTAYKVTDTLLRARGLVKVLSVWHWSYAGMVIAAAYIGQIYGLAGVAVGVTAAVFVNFAIGVILAKALCGISFRIVVFAFIRYGLTSLALGAGMYFLREHWLAADVAVWQIVGAGALVMLIVGIALWMVFPKLFGEEGVWIRVVISQNLTGMRDRSG